MDVAPIEPLALPVFSPLVGFSAVTMPEISLETQEIVEANSLWRRKTVKRGDVSSLTAHRGVTFSDGDFYGWIMAALTGNTTSLGNLNLTIGSLGASLGLSSSIIGGPTPRRDLLLVHNFKRDPYARINSDGSRDMSSNARAIASVASMGVDVGSRLIENADTAGVGALAAAAVTFSGSPLGPYDIYPFRPARAWLLSGCLPVRYKPGNDFDATSGQVSIMEIDIQIESMEEISLSG